MRYRWPFKSSKKITPIRHSRPFSVRHFSRQRSAYHRRSTWEKHQRWALLSLISSNACADERTNDLHCGFYAAREENKQIAMRCLASQGALFFFIQSQKYGAQTTYSKFCTCMNEHYHPMKIYASIFRSFLSLWRLSGSVK